MMNNRSIEAAKALQLQGRTAAAEALYRELVHTQPDDFRALEALGVLVFQQGRAHEALPLFARAVALQPGSARMLANLGEAFRVVGRHNEALDHLRKAVAVDPTLAQSWNSLGLLAFDQRRYAEAEASYRESIRLRPKFVAALINLGHVLQAQERIPEAAEVNRMALGIDPNNPLALMSLGYALSELAGPESLIEAETVSRRALALAPRSPRAINNLARVLRLQCRIDEAVACEERLSALNSRSLPVQQDNGRLTRQQPSVLESARGQERQGLSFLDESQLDKAEAAFREAVRLDPTLTISWTSLARIQAERGDFEQSCHSARAVLAASPKSVEAYWRLAITLRGRLPDHELQAMEELLGDESLSNDARSMLKFGLAAVLDGRGLYSRAASHLETANALEAVEQTARGLFYDPDLHSEFIAQMIAAFNADLLNRGRRWVEPNPRPVFVVGFPRSGTTLVEQIFASHSKVHGAGELYDVHRIFDMLPKLVGQPAYKPFDALEILGPDSANAAARLYLESLDVLAPPGAARVADKMPDNIRLLGLIAILWPGARVIVCERDPRDIAVSCWQAGFKTNPWSNVWEHLAQRFADHQRIVEHWRQVRPLEWLDFRYEDQVANPEGQARRLIDFVGLEWEPDCLEPHLTKRVVRTLSLVQVRQPIHSRSVGRWKNYESSLQPLLIAFKRHGVEVNNRSGRMA
jgi:tetratricopeptide (TPR) repeat protein